MTSAKELPLKEHFWPEGEEVLYPAEPGNLNEVISRLLATPVELPQAFWKSALHLYRNGHRIPFGEAWVPERVLLHLALSLKELLKNRDPIPKALAEALENPEDLARRVVGKSHAEGIKRQVFGQGHLEALAEKVRRLRQEPAQAPGPETTTPPKEPPPQAQKSQGQKESPPPPPTPPQEQRPKPSPATAPNDPSKEYPELYRAYKSGLFTSLVQRSIQKLLAEELEKLKRELMGQTALQPTPADRPTPAEVEEAIARLRERVEALEGRPDPLADLEKKLQELQEEMREIAGRLAELEEALGRLQESNPAKDLEAFKSGIRRVVRDLAQAVGELQALAFGPSGRPPLLPEEAVSMLERMTQDKQTNPSLLRRWLVKEQK
jgi:predicted  nucleic acid-binding Zn-ribbon protein